MKRLLDDKIRETGLQRFYRSTESEIRGINGTVFLFAGLRTNISSVKSMEGITRAWVEEAHTVSQDSLDVLKPTIRAPGSELWFTWNPQQETDPVDRMFRGSVPPPDCYLRRVNYDDNPWFPEPLRLEMEWDRRRDPAKYSHIWLGEYYKKRESLVFVNSRAEPLWRFGDPQEFETGEETVFRFGVDFGFSTDPSVMTRSFVKGRQIFVDNEAWALGCETEYLPFLFGGDQDEALIAKNQAAFDSDGMKRWLGTPGIPGATKWRSTADSARPETINHLRRHGFPKMVGARKGAGSVDDGVEWLRSHEIVVHPRCRYTADEFGYYSYKVDKQTGEVMPILLDKHNHTIDALRYAHERDMRLRKWGPIA